MQPTNKRTRTGNPALAVAYYRCSTEDQQIGPEAQRQQIARWCAANGVAVVAEFEEHVSGGAPLDKRLQLMLAVDALAANGAGLLLVAKRDRLARDTIAAAMVERLAERAGAVVRCADGVGNGDGPEALLMRRMLDAFAEYERAIIRARTKAALAVKKSAGERVGQVPFGWQVAVDGVHLEPCEAEQEVIRLARGLKASGASLRAIGAELKARRLANRGGSNWHPQSVANVLKSEVAA